MALLPSLPKVIQFRRQNRGPWPMAFSRFAVTVSLFVGCIRPIVGEAQPIPTFQLFQADVTITSAACKWFGKGIYVCEIPISKDTSSIVKNNNNIVLNSGVACDINNCDAVIVLDHFGPTDVRLIASKGWVASPWMDSSFKMTIHFLIAIYVKQ